MSREIPLSQGKVAIVDDEDYDLVSQFKWHAHLEYSKTWYARRKQRVDGRDQNVLLHRVILDAPPGVLVDHINHDGLDNRRVNLRLCTQSQNLMNQGPYRNNTSGFKGVNFHKRDRHWRAQISVNKRLIFLGYHDSPEDAARAYDAAALQYYGEFATLNFPNTREDNQ